MSYEHPVDHRTMALDTHRNAFYRRALKKWITPESVVLDLGAGLGGLGLMAASLGAKRVYLVEPTTPLEVARRLAVHNQLDDRITCIQAPIERADLGEQVDIIISVFTGNFLLEEDLLPSLAFARDTFLAPGGKLLPEGGQMWLQPVSLPGTYERQIDSWRQEIHGLSFDVMAPYALNQPVHDHFNEETIRIPLAPAGLVKSFDFMKDTVYDCDERLSFSVAESGVLHGCLGWFDMSAGRESLSTGPDSTPTHWRQIFFPLDALDVRQGERLTVSIRRRERGEWHWRVETPERQVQHSAFLSRPVSPGELASKSLSYTPEIGAEGHLVARLLAKFDGRTSLGELAQWLLDEAPERFPDHPSAVHFVETQIGRFCDL